MKASSLIIEMQACRSDAFLAWLGPELHAAFGGDAAPYARRQSRRRLWRRVERGFIRVDADEMTYPAHVILRFRLEQAMVVRRPGGRRPARRLERGHAGLLGMTPPDDARGCLQDIHWYDGAFGYFPSYTLGAMAAAQLMAAARRAVPDLDAALAGATCRRWSAGCARNVHSMGSLLGFNDLLRAATGKPARPGGFRGASAGAVFGVREAAAHPSARNRLPGCDANRRHFPPILSEAPPRAPPGLRPWTSRGHRPLHPTPVLGLQGQMRA